MTQGRSRVVTPVLLSVLVLVLLPGGGSAAAFSDTAPATSGVISGSSLPSPAGLPAAASCTANNGVFSSTLNLNWGGITPAAGAPPLSAYEYQVQFLDRNNNNQVLNTVERLHVGAAGAQQSYTITSGTFENLLGLNWLSQNRITTQVRSHLLGTSWYGTTTVPVNWTTTTVFGVTSFNCLQ